MYKMNRELKKITLQTIKTVIAINQFKHIELDEKDSEWLENKVTRLLDERNCNYRMAVEDMVIEELKKIK